MTDEKKASKLRIIFLLVLFLTIMFLLPFLYEIASVVFRKGWVELFSIPGGGNPNSGFKEAIIRSLVFSVLTSLICVLVGFLGALILIKVRLFTKKGGALSLLLLPVVVGNTSIAFLAKVLLSQTSFFGFIVDKGSLSILGVLLIIQCWQFGFLFLYLFWLNFQNLSQNLVDYADSVKLSTYQKIKDILLPHSKNLVILLFLIGFVFNFYEDAKSQLIFKASQGTNTELIAHWVGRTYQSSLVALSNPDLAITKTFTESLFIFVIAVFVFGLIIFVINFSINTISKVKIRTKSRFGSPREKIRNIAISVLLLSVLVPFILIFFKFTIPKFDSLKLLKQPLALTLAASAFASLFAIVFGISSRVSLKRILNNFNHKSSLILVTIYILQLIPPFVVLLCGFKWLSYVGYRFDPLIWVVWIFGHTLLSFAILGSFILIVHFGVKNSELDYLEASKIPFSDIVKTSFWRRFKLQYILTVLFSFTFIWNEAILNRVFSDQIQSFVASLDLATRGRGADFSKASGFFLVSIFLSSIIVVVWLYVLKKANKTSQINEDN